MGFQDRQYDKFEQDNAWSRRNKGGGLSKLSIITLIIIANVIVWLLDSFSPLVTMAQLGAPADLPGADAANGSGTHWLNYFVFGLDPSRPWAIWSYLTYGFSHAAIDSSTSFWHIGGNMLALFFLGRPVVYRLGRNEFLKFYLVSIVICGIGYMAVAWIFGLSAYVVGASGAVSAVVFLFIFMYPKEKVLFWGIIPMYAWVLGVFVVLMDLKSALNPDSHVAWQVHLIGAAFAIAYFKLGWNFEKFAFPSLAMPSSSAKLRVHNPDAKLEKLKLDADRILKKISEQGEASLSRGERKTLNKYSEAIRKQQD